MALAERPYQENQRNIEKKRNRGICDKRDNANSIDILHVEIWQFSEDRHNGVHDSAYRGVVVERDKWIHLEVWRAQNLLDHHQPGSLKHDAGDLVDEARQIKHDFTE